MATNKQCTHDHLELRLWSPESGEVLDSRKISRQELEAH